MWFIFDFVRSDLTLTVLCLCVCFFFSFSFALFCWKTHTQSDEKFPSSLAFFIYFFVRGEMAPHEWKWINWLLRFSAFFGTYIYISIYTIYTLYICMYCELQLEVIYMQIDGAAELTHVPNNWSTFWKRPVPATLSSNGLKRHKKNVAKAKWKLWNKYTKRAIRDLWQAFMATQIFVKCLPKYLFNQSRTGYCVFEIYPRDFYI